MKLTFQKSMEDVMLVNSNKKLCAFLVFKGRGGGTSDSSQFNKCLRNSFETHFLNTLNRHQKLNSALLIEKT